jgi:hypothetical protein
MPLNKRAAIVTQAIITNRYGGNHQMGCPVKGPSGFQFQNTIHDDVVTKQHHYLLTNHN